jgi:tetratricopeptide (TPR) repeat protein
VPAHPSDEELERLVLGGLAPEEVERVLGHLVLGCERCRGVTAAFWSVGSRPEEDAAALERACRFEYGEALARALAAARSARSVLEAEKQEALRLWAELEPLEAERRRELLSELRFRSRGLCELLLYICRGGKAAETAELAVAVAATLEPPDHPPALIEDLRARAWSALADCRRRLADLDGAERALETARSHLAKGTGGCLERAVLFDLEAALRHAQGRPDEALRLGRRALALYRRAGSSAAFS